ncbi:MAG: restriction endonuclease subunit R, partial [Chlorobiaceae bacterium]|nr:restriction endonuclease subunit R [Chlorobiaceae bacterium]
EREIQHMIATSFWSSDGKVISAEEFLQGMFGVLPEFFKSEDELKELWSDPKTRRTLLEKLADAGYGKQELESIQNLINAEKSDLFDVLEYISFAHRPITREARVADAKESIYSGLDEKQKEFIQFVLAQYIDAGVGELDQEKLPHLLRLKYHALPDAMTILGTTDRILSTFVGFQKHLYQQSAA